MGLRPDPRRVAERFLHQNPVAWTERHLRRYAAECWLIGAGQATHGWARTSDCLAFADAVLDEAKALSRLKTTAI